MVVNQSSGSVSAEGKGDLEEAMRSLNLSSVERKGIKLGKKIVEGAVEETWHAVGKVLSDRYSSNTR